MNYKDYKAKKDANTVEVIKAGGGYAFASKRFNIETGIAEAPEIEAVDTKTLTDKKVELQTEITSIDSIIADINALK